MPVRTNHVYYREERTCSDWCWDKAWRAAGEHIDTLNFPSWGPETGNRLTYPMMSRGVRREYREHVAAGLWEPHAPEEKGEDDERQGSLFNM
ncbi:MAG: hypothetical protein ACXABY_14330 [Candidatus Thorarchaeota archaeon]